MAADKGGKKPAAKAGSAKSAKKKGKSLSSLYNITGEKAERKNKFCPKCGSGIFLAVHKDRVTCGKCNYTEFKKN